MDMLIYNTFIVNTSREEKKVEAGKTIINRGDFPDKIFYIKSGNIELASNKRLKSFTNKRDKSFLGIKELVLKTQYQYTARTIIPTTLVEIEADEFLEKFKANPELRLQILACISHDINTTKNSPFR